MEKPPPLASHFVMRKLHSLLGVVPAGVFLCFHLFMNSKAIMEGKEHLGETFSFAEVVRSIESLHPTRAVLNAVELLFIFLPLLLHGIYGLVIVWQGQVNVLTYRYGRNWMFALQRWTGLAVFAFLILHVWRMRLSNPAAPDLAWAPEQVFQVLHASLQSPLILGAYILGVAASSLHFANGLWLVGITWGLTVGPRSQRLCAAGAAAVLAALLLLGGLGLYGFAVLEPAAAAGAGR